MTKEELMTLQQALQDSGKPQMRYLQDAAVNYSQASDKLQVVIHIYYSDSSYNHFDVTPKSWTLN